MSSILLCALATEPAPSSDPTYDHQTVNYTSKFKPVSQSAATLSVTPFFSPDNSAQVRMGTFSSCNDGLRRAWQAYQAAVSTCGACAVAHTTWDTCRC